MDTITFPCIYLKKELAAGGFYEGMGAEEITGSDPVKKAAEIRGTMASGIMVFDFSQEDLEHDRAIGKIKEICREAVLPVYGAGNIRRVEDVKKLLYAGCEKAVLNFRNDSNKEMLEEVSKRFGSKKIGVFVPDYNTYLIYQEEIETYAGMILIDQDEDTEEKLFEDTKLEVLVHDDASGICELKNVDDSEKVPAMAWTDFKLNSDGLLPVVVQDYKTNEVLMMAYMNEEAYQKTLESGRMTYWSRSRQELWLKGLTSGHFQFVKSLTADCDNDTLLAKVAQVGAACHTGSYSCFFNEILKKDYEDSNPEKVFEQVYNVIADRKVNPKEGSYTNYLFDKGIDKILKKVGEESTEIIIAAKNPEKEETIYEISDFLYHCMVLMVEKGLTWDDITRELSNRE